MTKLTREFYANPVVTQISQALLGKHLCTYIDGCFTSGIIVETEAYCGATDKACHAHFNRFTKRTHVMYGEPGCAYIYLCYGIHHLFNIVTNIKGMADAVLIRAVEPVEGIEHMLARRAMAKIQPALTAGPGVMASALGISKRWNGADLTGNQIWIEDSGQVREPTEVVASPRIGIDYAGEDLHLAWRYRIRNNPWCSKAKSTPEKNAIKKATGIVKK